MQLWLLQDALKVGADQYDFFGSLDNMDDALEGTLEGALEVCSSV